MVMTAIMLTAGSSPEGVKQPAFPARTDMVAGRAMIRVRFGAPGYYRVTAAGPDGSAGWATLVVLPAHHRPSRSTAGFSGTGL